MPWEAEGGQPVGQEDVLSVLFIGREKALRDEVAGALDPEGYRVYGAPLDGSVAADASAALAIVQGVPDAEYADRLAACRSHGTPVLAIVDSAPDPVEWGERSGENADWVLRTHLGSELAVRAACLVRRNRHASARLTVDGRFFSVVIHDLRTPLNVIGLSLRMIGQAVPKGDPELDEDLRFIDENFRQLERMLAQLSDYFRLFEGREPLYVAEFSPRTLLAEVLESRALKSGPKATPVRLDVKATCPASVALDQARARMALQHAIANAASAAGEAAVTVTMRGETGRWIVEIATDRPPPSSVESMTLRAHQFERLCGTAAERRGMDLAIAARVSELFQGNARLDIVPGLGTTLVFDWPARLPESP